MLSILGWLVKIYNLLTEIHQQTTQILKGQKEQATSEEVAKLQADVDIIKKVLGIGIPVTETIIFGQPK